MPNPCQAHLAAKMPADHSETGSTAIHLVDLHNVVDFADPLATFAEQALLVSERLFLLLGFGRRLLTVQLHFVVNLCLRRKQLGREIKWDARFCFCLVKDRKSTRLNSSHSQISY